MAKEHGWWSVSSAYQSSYDTFERIDGIRTGNSDRLERSRHRTVGRAQVGAPKDLDLALLIEQIHRRAILQFDSHPAGLDLDLALLPNPVDAGDPLRCGGKVQLGIGLRTP